MATQNLKRKTSLEQSRKESMIGEQGNEEVERIFGKRKARQL